MRRHMGMGRTRGRRAGLCARSLALSLALTTVLITGRAQGEPGDIFTLGAPVIGSPPPKATPIADGDASVSTQTGALQYSYPIAVPPGRNGMSPHLSLAYSSQAAIYGGLAAGWTLAGIPIITQDTSDGTLSTQVSGIRYASSLAGGRPLLQTSDPVIGGSVAYRAQNDATFTRYQRVVLHTDGDDDAWTVFTTDGIVYHFGQPSHEGTCAIFSDGYAPLTEESDSFGNIVDYSYTAGVDGECLISSISWGKNSGAGIQDHFATVAFDYGSAPTGCPAGYPGSLTSYRTGIKIVTGASRLGTITITAYPPGSPNSPEYTRVITLGYDDSVESCTAAHAPYRALASITETASGTNVSTVNLPPVTFSYGNASVGSGSLAYSGSVPTTLPWNLATQAPGPSVNYNLGWGYRFSNSVWPTVEAMSIDVDGDGLVDRLVNASRDTDGFVRTCRAHWYRNRGPAFSTFEDKGTITLPTLKWGNPGSLTGGQYAGEHSQNERCALNFQYTAYTNSDDLHHAFVCPNADPNNLCPAPPYYCTDPNLPNYGDDCRQKSYDPYAYETYLAYRWIDFDGDGRVDLVASPTQGGLEYYNLQQGSRVGATAEPALFGSWPSCPSGGSYSAYPYPDEVNKPYTMCGGMFPWFVYLNSGNGTFGVPQGSGAPLPTKIVYQPIPLETSNGDSSILSAPVGQFQGWVDVDGDGFSDAVVADATGQSATWNVFRNDGTGQLVPDSTLLPFSFAARTGADLTFTDCVDTGSCNPVETQGLVDLNGDGLADEWISTAQGAAGNVALNFGDHFDTTNGVGAIDAYPRPGTDGLSNVTSSGTRSSKLGNVPMVFTGTRTDNQRLLDIDLDGRPDVIAPGANYPYTPSVHFNQGLGYGGGAGTLVDGFGLTHLIVAGAGVQEYDYMNPGTTAYTWAIRSDMLDLDGDGIPEGLNFYDQPIANQLYVSRVASTASQLPPRLLVGIDNHRGATTSITYSSMAGAAVTQEPAAGKAMPRTQWVVNAITGVDSFSGTQSTTSYLYKDPHWGADDEGRYAFRGFEHVTATGPSGAQTISDYSYTPDWSGRLVSTQIAPAASEATVSGEVRSIDDTTWEAHTVGAITTYHPRTQDHWTCENGKTADECRSSTSGRTHTIHTWSPLSPVTSNSSTVCANHITDPNEQPFVWEETSSRLQAGEDAVDGDRVTDTCYVLTAAAKSYHLSPQLVTRSWQVSGSLVMFAKSSHSFDQSNIVPVTDEVWVDANDDNRAITQREYDMTTGNVFQRRKPNQVAASGPFLTYTFDARKLFPASQIDEMGMELDYIYEYGTGTKLETQGPNVASCSLANPPTCPSGSLTKQDSRIAVDGIGRTTERWEAFGDGISAYTPYKVETFTYQDHGDSSLNPSITHQQAISVNSAGVVTYAQDKTDLDGHGRPTKVTKYVFGSAPADQVTTYGYGNDGTLRTVTVPDPSANSAAVVSYTYGYDSLARPTSLRRPDTSVLTDQSGVNISYDGLMTTTTEVVVSGDGNASVTDTIKDAFGRLVEVDEHLSGGQFITSAITTYGYDAADRVNRITDPEQLVTTLGYDLAGNRTQITRPSGTWSFAYDKNGNVSTATTPYPCAEGDPCEARYVTTFAYDDLDRMTSKLLAPRELSSDDIALFAADTETFTWDAGVPGHTGNYRGQLISWKAFPPGANPNGSGTVSLFLRHDAQGNDILTSSGFAAAGYSSLASRSLVEYFNISGTRRFEQYQDQIGASTAVTQASFYFDQRGLPRYVQVERTNQPGTAVAVGTRNVAGLVINQKTTVSGAPTSPITSIESDWTYDPLGRVTSQLVQTAPGSTRVAEQDLAYFGNDDPKTLDQYLGNSHRQFAYGYDMRHQLTNANETTSSDYLTSSYEYGRAGRFGHVTEQSLSPAPGSEVKSRDVNYEYGGSDPEQVTALTNRDGTTYASYTYDGAGNQTSRCYGGAISPCAGESTEYVYDGEDQLRRATKKQDGVTVSSEEYWYDDRGGRLATVKRDASGNKTELIWFLGDTEAHYDGVGTLQHVYSYINLGTPVARTDRTGPSSATLEFLFHGLGNNTLAAVDRDTGRVDASFSYAPFGEIVESTDAGSATGAGVAAHRRRMNDKYVDEVSDLAYYGARYYDKTLMTWTQADPLYRFNPDEAWIQPRRANLYTAELNNPLRYLDPDGRSNSLAAAAAALGGDLAEGLGISLSVATVGMGAVVGVGVAAAIKEHPGTLEDAEMYATDPLGEQAKAKEAAETNARATVMAQNVDQSDAEPTTGHATNTAQEEAPTAAATPQPGPEGPLPKPPRGKGSAPESERDPKRAWTPKERAAKRKEQNNKCANGCGTDIDEKNSRGHHKNTRWADGGRTDDANHAEVCVTCHKDLHSPD